MMELPRRSVILVIDGLRGDALGTYGNTWFETPACDTLAAESLVYDWSTSTAPTLEGFYHTAWNTDTATRELLAMSLLTDDPQVARLAEQYPFREVTHCQTVLRQSAAEDIADTSLAGFFAQASDFIRDWMKGPATDERAVAWLHCGALTRTWDAPPRLCESLLEDDDPRPPAGCQVPCERLNRGDDPDPVFGWKAAYAGQIITLDACLEAMRSELEEAHLLDKFVFLLTSIRGMPLGEHRSVGFGESDPLYEEEIHVPCVVRTPGMKTSRRNEDLIAAAEFAGRIAAGHPAAVGRQYLVAQRGAWRAVRTHDWYLTTLSPGPSKANTANRTSPCMSNQTIGTNRTTSRASAAKKCRLCGSCFRRVR